MFTECKIWCERHDCVVEWLIVLELVRRLPTETVYKWLKWTRMKMFEGKMVSKILCLRRCYEHGMSAQWCPSAAHGKTAAFGIVALFGPQVIMFSVLRFERSPFTCTLWAFLIVTYSLWSGWSCSLQRAALSSDTGNCIVGNSSFDFDRVWKHTAVISAVCFLDAWPCRHARSGFSRCKPLDLLILSCHLQGSKECRRAHQDYPPESQGLCLSVLLQTVRRQIEHESTREEVRTQGKKPVTSTTAASL